MSRLQTFLDTVVYIQRVRIQGKLNVGFVRRN